MHIPNTYPTHAHTQTHTSQTQHTHTHTHIKLKRKLLKTQRIDTMKSKINSALIIK